MHHEHGISIWFFIGSLLLVYGILITGAEIHALSNPPAVRPILWEYHAGLWWGLLLIAIGAFYCLRFPPKKKKG
jgi:hypothetical protein